MGRKKIAITRISDERNRQITFSKRKSGLLKKAYELSILCDVEIAVIMITGNNKLYQYASSNMNSILIRYTEFKDPDESKTNADILEDITRKERGAHAHDDSGGEEEESSSQFLLTPRTHAHYQKIGEEFDQMLQHNQLPTMPAAMSSGSATHAPQAMPVSVPVTQSPSTIHQQIYQHLQQQMEQRSASTVNMSSASSSSSIISPQSSSDLSSSGPGSSKGLLQKSPGTMPPPLNTPTRLQTLRNQTLKLHLPGSGRNYISLGPGSSSTSPNRKGSSGGGEGEEEGGGQGGGAGAGGGTGSKPQLRVVIPGQKEFVPRTQSTSPLPQVGFNAAATTQPQSTNSESLTTPILSLHTPNLFSSLPPLFSSFMGDFPFGVPPTSSGGPGGGGTGDGHSALVAFPVSIQPSALSGSTTGSSNIVLQAQNMGQPFLLTPTVDARSNPLFSSATFTPPTTLAGTSPGQQRDFEHLKHQYDRLQQQILQQQLLLQQGLHHHQQQLLQQHSKGATGTQPSTQNAITDSSSQDLQDKQEHSQFISSTDIMITSPSGPSRESEASASKRPRLETSTETSL